MSFETGSITFRRFAVLGQHDSAPSQEMLDRLIEHALHPGEFGAEEVEYGWSGGKHLHDGIFHFDSNVYADCISFALRIDTNKVPAAVKKAYTLECEGVMAKNNPSGFISKAQKREAKDDYARRCEQDVKAGKFRRSKLIPILWDVPNQILYSPASGDNFAKLAEIFERTFKLELQPLSAGETAHRALVELGKRREYEDARPTRFNDSGPDGQTQPDYPWGARGTNTKDFLGNEFLLWLWQRADRAGEIIVANRPSVAILFDRSLDLDCTYGATGKDALRGTAPTRTPEAKEALRIGKVPRLAGIILNYQGSQFECAIQAETLAITSLKLPAIEDAETPRVLIEERIDLLRNFNNILDALFKSFLQYRFSGQWPASTKEIRNWITEGK